MPIQPNNPSYERMILIDEQLRKNRYPNRAKLADLLEVNQKTIQRDVDFLRDRMKAPIQYDRRRKGFYYTDQTWFFPAVQLKAQDLFSMLIARQAIEQYRGTPLANELQSIYDRIVGPLTQKISVTSNNVSPAVSFSAPATLSVKEDVWNAIIQALRTNKTVRIRHRSIGKENYEEKTICPYHLVCLQGEWYVLAGTLASEEVRQYALGRIAKAIVSRIPATVPEGFDATDLLNHTFGRFVSKKDLKTIEVRIDKKMGPLFADRRWHAMQKIETLPSGDYVISFPVSASGPWPYFHVINWILSWGRYAKVLNPPELADMVRVEIREMAARV